MTYKKIVFVLTMVILCRISVSRQVQAAASNGYEADSLTYIQFSDMNEALPVSYIKKGRQMLNGDGEKNLYSILQTTLLREALPAEKLLYKTEADSAIYEKRRSPDYSCRVMTSGKWELFPGEVRYQSYSLRKQPAKSGWNRYFKKYLKNHVVDSPVVIKESYTFDWNGVGMELVTASNVMVREGKDCKIADGRNKKGILPLNRNAAVYTISALFKNGKAVLDVFSNIQRVSVSERAFEPSGSGISFWQPSDGSWYQDYIGSVQIGTDGKHKKFRCCFNMYGESSMREYCYFPEFLICDMDGDGKSEVIVYHGGSDSLRQRIVIYRRVHGKLERSFSIGP